MSDEIDVKLDMRGLEAIIKALKNEAPYGRVGVLGKSKSREGDGDTNAEIGLKHEFGDPASNLPMRSFLRMPLMQHFKKRLDSSQNLFTENILKEVIKHRSIVPWLRLVVIEAEGTVLDAFDTGGFGVWKPSNMKYKKNHQTLVETQQLRNSITSEVKDD